MSSTASRFRPGSSIWPPLVSTLEFPDGALLPSAVLYRPDQGQKSNCERRGQHSCRQQLTRPSSLTSSLQPLTCRFPKTVLDCREGTSFILPTQVNSTNDSMGVAHALTPSQQTQTQTAARKSLPTEPQHPDACAANPGCLFLEEPRQRGERRCHGQRVCELAAVQISSRQSRAVCDSPRPRAESRPGHRKGSAAVGGGRMGEVVTRVGLAVFSPHPAPSNVSNSQRDNAAQQRVCDWRLALGASIVTSRPGRTGQL